MEDELRLSLLVVGTLIILGVLAHGIWKIRKSNKSTPRERVEPGEWESHNGEREEPGFDHDGWDEPRHSHSQQHNDFDDLGLGKVRVVSASQDSVSATGSAEHDDTVHPASGSADSKADNAKSSQSMKNDQVQQERLYGSVVTHPKPHMSSGQSAAAQGGDEQNEIPEPPGFLLRGTDKTVTAPAKDNDADDSSFSLDSPQGHIEASDDDNASGSDNVARKRRSRPMSRHRQEPGFGDDQMRIDFDEPGAKSADAEQTAPATNTADKTQTGQQQEVLILNIKAAEDDEISGAALLPLLLTLGFKFGEQDIFHRHVNSNGKGPVLFSLANMFKPGSFDIDNLETFTTKGVSLFMILPIEGDAHQVFNMMHNAARKIADEFNAQVLDGRRSVLTKQGLQQYIEKIRDFERRRIASRAL